MSLSISAMRTWIFSNIEPNLSAWGLDCICWLLVGYNSRVIWGIVAVCTCVFDSWAYGVAKEMCSLFGVLDEWLLLAWRDIMDIGRRRFNIFPSDGGLTPSRSMIFMMRPQNEIHACVADRAAIFPMIWKMWAHISIGAPVIRSLRN